MYKLSVTGENWVETMIAKWITLRADWSTVSWVEQKTACWQWFVLHQLTIGLVRVVGSRGDAIIRRVQVRLCCVPAAMYSWPPRYWHATDSCFNADSHGFCAVTPRYGLKCHQRLTTGRDEGSDMIEWRPSSLVINSRSSIIANKVESASVAQFLYDSTA